MSPESLLQAILHQKVIYLSLLLGLIITLTKTPIFKGWLGELIVNLGLKFFLDNKKYRLLKNVTLPTEDGKTTQIDHIVVSQYGIFVIETKNMKGWIFGGPHQKTWTQKIYKHTRKFQNPLHQNYKHVKTIEVALNALNISASDKIFPVVVFVGDSTFKTNMPPNVTYGAGFLSYIKTFQKIIFSPEEVDEIVRIIQSGRLKPGIATHVKHVNNVKALRKNHSRRPRRTDKKRAHMSSLG